MTKNYIRGWNHRCLCETLDECDLSDKDKDFKDGFYACHREYNDAIYKSLRDGTIPKYPKPLAILE